MGNAHLKLITRCLSVYIDGCKHFRHVLAGDFGMQYAVYMRNVGIHGMFAYVRIANVYRASDYLACFQLVHKFYRPFLRKHGVYGLNALYEARCRIGNVVQLPCGRADAAALERSGFKQRGLCVCGYFAVQSTHNARYANALFGIGYKQHVRRHGALLAVQRGYYFVFVCVAHNNVAVLYAGKVERMHRVAVFNQHIVCYVNYVVYGPHADRAQALLHPCGGRFNIKVSYNARRIAGTKFGVFNRYGRIIMNVALALDMANGRFLEFLAQRCRRFAAHTDYALAVRTVRRKLYIEHYVIHAYGFLYALPKGMILMQYHYAVELRAGIVRLAQAKLMAGAKHAVAFYAAHNGRLNNYAFGKMRAVHCNGHQRPFKNIGRAGDYAKRFLRANVYGAYLKVVGILMLAQGYYFADNNICNAVHLAFVARALEAAPHQFFNKFIWRYVPFNVIFQPTKWKFHVSLPP